MNEKRVVIKEQSLIDLADQLRVKTGTTTQYTVDDMAVVISNIGSPELEELYVEENGEYTPEAYGYSKVTVEVQPELEEINITENGEYLPEADGFGKVVVNCPPGPPEEAFTITGNCDYKFSNNGWNWFIENYGNKINTVGISGLLNFCNNSNKLTEIPFTVNVSNCTNLQQCFSGCHKLIESPKVRGTLTGEVNLMDMIHNCQLIRDFEDLFEADMLESFSTYKVTSAYTCPKPVTFYYCYSLRKIPSWWYLLRLNPESTAFPTNSYSLYRNCVNSCHALDEITNIPVWHCVGAQTSDMFSGFAGNAYRLKEVTFETNNGQPIVTKWKSQTIRLDNIGSTFGPYSEKYVLNYNSGITKDKLVTDDASYQALKNDPDWYSTDILYGRYNHDSAVRTINSLPDTSAYLATAGGTNTIMFARNSGYHTDGGHPGLLTAEEIAVAAAKGWTVTLV